MALPVVLESRRDAGIALPVAVVLILFAGSFPAYKAATDGVGVAVTSGIRFASATVILLLLARRQLGGARGALRPLLLVGAVGLGGQALAMTAGIDAGTSTLGALLLGLEPIGIAVLGALLLRERPTRAGVAGLLVGLFGVAVVSGAVTVGLSHVPGRALAFLLLTVVLFSLYTVEVRRYSQRLDPLAVAAITSLGATLLTVPLALGQAATGGALHGAGPPQLLALVYLGPGTGLAYALFAWLLARVTSATMAVFLYLLPPLGAVASWLVLGEQPLARDVVGGALILLAVFIAQRGAPAPRGLPEAP